jgi:hypothetical protein
VTPRPQGSVKTPDAILHGPNLGPKKCPVGVVDGYCVTGGHPHPAPTPVCKNNEVLNSEDVCIQKHGTPTENCPVGRVTVVKTTPTVSGAACDKLPPPPKEGCGAIVNAVALAKCVPKKTKCGIDETLVNGICVPHEHCKTGTHFVMTLGCVKNHLTPKEAFNLGYKMGLTDGDDQENYVGTGGLKGHSKAFTAGYNCAFGHFQCPKGFHPPA